MTDASPVRREDLISRREAARLLDIHANTLDRAAREAGLKKYSVVGDNRVFYRRDQIADLSTITEVGES